MKKTNIGAKSLAEAKDFLRKNKSLGLNQKITLGNHTYMIALVKPDNKSSDIRFIQYRHVIRLLNYLKVINLNFDLRNKKWQFTDSGPWEDDLTKAANAYFVKESLMITKRKMQKIKDAEAEEIIERNKLDSISPWAKVNLTRSE